MTLIQPFIEFGFMRRALVACLALAVSATPLGHPYSPATYQPDWRCLIHTRGIRLVLPSAI